MTDSANSKNTTAMRPASPKIRSLLQRLHNASGAQEKSIPREAILAIESKMSTDPEAARAAMDELMLDKYIALDEDKSQFVYNLMLANGSRNVVEIGTSYGVSTIYLALAVVENMKRSGKPGVVIATEKETPKATVARAYWKEAGTEVEEVIELKEGDLTEILATSAHLPKEPIDFVLMDIWPYVALPALNLLMPHLRPGAVILTDNVYQAKDGYADYLRVLNNPDGPFNNVILPYAGGFQMSTFNP